MTNTTATYWSVDGISLNTFAWNIETVGGSRQAPPELRGSNVIVPFRAGAIWMPKVPDERVITLGMWVQGSDEDGRVPTDRSQQDKYQQNWESLRTLLWQPYRQMKVAKYVRYPDGTLNRVTALAQFEGGLEPSMTGGARAAFTVDLRLADPYFYGATIQQNVSSRTQFTAIGNARTTRMSIAVNGPKSTPRIALDIADFPDPYVQYNGTVSAGDNLVMDVNAGTAIYNGSSNRTGLVVNDNAPQWLYLDPGTNTVLVSGSGGGGVTLNYQPAFL